MKANKSLQHLFTFTLLALVSCYATAAPLGTAFTYQGKLADSGQPANGSYDLKFTLHDAASGGSAVAGPITNSAVSVSNGLFTVPLDFGEGVFTGDACWLEMAVRPTGDTNTFVTLSSRLELTPTPYAIHAASAGTAANLSGTLPATQITGTLAASQIAAGTIDTSKLAAGSVSASNLAPGSVTTPALADGAVTASKLMTVPEVRSILTIPNPTPAADDLFGAAAAWVGTDRLLIGAHRDDTVATDAGAAYLFDLNGNVVVTFTNPAPPAGGGFGFRVASFGADKVLISAWPDWHPAPGPTNVGVVYIFNTNGTLLVTFINPTPAAGDAFGSSLAALGTDQVLIGAYLDDTAGSDSGAVYSFKVDGTLLTTFTKPAATGGEGFGWSVAAVGADKVLIGAQYDDAGEYDAGAAYLFDTNGTLLTTFTDPRPVQWGNFGFAVAAVGSDKVLIGELGGLRNPSYSGAAYLFSTNGTLLTTFDNPNPAAYDEFGSSLSVLGSNRVVISAVQYQPGSSGAGVAYVLDLAGNALVTITNPAPAAGYGFGYDVAVGADHRVLISAAGRWGPSSAGTAYLVSLGDYVPGMIVEGVRPGGVTTLTNPANSFAGSFAGNGTGLVNLSADAVVGGITTNISVFVPFGVTNMLCFTNGILRAIR